MGQNWHFMLTLRW